jgi:hypothetical protein
MSKFFDVTLFKTSKKLIIKFFDVLIFATSKNFDAGFFDQGFKMSKSGHFFVVLNSNNQYSQYLITKISKLQGHLD